MLKDNVVALVDAILAALPNSWTRTSYRLSSAPRRFKWVA